jgi:DNA repair photolyase
MIISCSRRTDIPAFYSDWFFNRIREGFVQVQNPVNANQLRQVSLAPPDVDCIVFWTKNPAPMLDRFHLLKDYNYYFQFTLTPYNENIEPNLPPKTEIIDTFLKLSDNIGKKRIIWRYDPILLSASVNIEYHVEHFERIAKRLSSHTEKCVISFMDLYRHLQGKSVSFPIRPPDEIEMRMLAEKITAIAGANNIKVETCAEQVELADLGIQHGKCIDDGLISELTGMNMKIVKDKKQRELCGCVTSVDIGEYNTCRHLCRYCYANSSTKTIEKNLSWHNDKSPLLIGEISDKQKINERKGGLVLIKRDF